MARRRCEKITLLPSGDHRFGPGDAADGRARAAARAAAISCPISRSSCSTAQGTVESAVEAIKEGRLRLPEKPVDPARLRILLQKAVERQETLREVKQLRRQLREQGSFGRIIGNSPSIRAIYRTIEQAAPTAPRC